MKEEVGGITKGREIWVVNRELEEDPIEDKVLKDWMRTKGIAEVGIKIISDTMMNITIQEGGGIREGIDGEDTIIKDQETGNLDPMIDIKMLKRKIRIKMTVIIREME